MSEQKKALHVMRVVDQILRLSTTVTEEEIDEALEIIGKADATFGVLSEEWKQKAKQWVDTISNPLRDIPTSPEQSCQGIKLILEALLHQ